MSQAGYTPIQLYLSTTASAVPSAGNLANGELAINITDGRLFYKDNGGVVQVLATKGAGTIGGSNTQVQYNNAGALAGSANLTFDGTTLTAAGLAGPHNGTVGATTPNTGAFTTLSASSTVSGAGFSTYLASPPAIGGTAANTGAFTTLAASGAVTLSGGTANGVAYLNGSKVLTTGSALTFDGTNFGIGTSSPVNLLTVQTAATGTTAGSNVIARLQSNASGRDATLQFSDNVANSSTLSMVGGATVFRQNGTESMRITSAGDVGIGTSSPAARLDVSGTSRIRTDVSSATVIATATNAAANAYATYRIDSNDYQFYTTGSEKMRIDSSGNVGMGTSSPGTYSAKLAVVSTAADTRIAVIDDTSNGRGGYLRSNYSDAVVLGTTSGVRDLVFAPDNTERARISTSGNLLVGTTSGSYKVDVSGDVNVTGSYRVNGVATTGLTGGQTGSAPLYGARAWVNFNGTGTVAIRASGNVSSITDNGTGDYTVNFATAMPDANYALTASADWDNGSLNMTTTWRSVVAGSCRVRTAYGINNTLYDALGVYVTAFR